MGFSQDLTYMSTRDVLSDVSYFNSRSINHMTRYLFDGNKHVKKKFDLVELSIGDGICMV